MTTAKDIRQAMEKWRPTKEGAYVILHEVRNGVGYKRGQDRTADAMIFGCWPSRGLTIEGVEIKVSRSDWLKELADPTKADALARFCHRWWLATTPDVVDPGELPPRWGHVVLRRGVLRVESEPDTQLPEPPDDLMLASIIRNASRSAQANSAQAMRAEYQRGRSEANANFETAKQSLDAVVEKLTEVLGFSPLSPAAPARIERAFQAEQGQRAMETDHRSVQRARSMAQEIAEILGGLTD